MKVKHLCYSFSFGQHVIQVTFQNGYVRQYGMGHPLTVVRHDGSGPRSPFKLVHKTKPNRPDHFYPVFIATRPASCLKIGDSIAPYQVL